MASALGGLCYTSWKVKNKAKGNIGDCFYMHKNHQTLGKYRVTIVYKYKVIIYFIKLSSFSGIVTCSACLEILALEMFSLPEMTLNSQSKSLKRFNRSYLTSY